MSRIVACESNEDHIDDGKNGESENTGKGKSEEGLVELIVKERAQILLAAFDLFALCSDVHTDAALLYLKSPGVDECHDEDDGEKSVKHYFNGVVTSYPYVGVVDGVILEAALNGTDCFTDLEPISLGKPVKSAAGNKHISEKYDFKYEEENSAHDLTVIEVSESKN